MRTGGLARIVSGGKFELRWHGCEALIVAKALENEGVHLIEFSGVPMRVRR